MDFWSFVKAVFDTWAEKVGIILTFIPFLEKVPRVKKWLGEKPILERFAPLLWFIGGVCIIWGFYSAWKDQKAEVQKAKTETAQVQTSLDALNKPILSAPVSMISVAPSRQHKENSLVTVLCHFRNAGAATTLENFNITVLKGPKEFRSDIVWQFANMNLYVSNSKSPSVALLAKNHISNRLSQVIDRNTVADGWVQVVVDGFSREKIISAGTKLILTYRDIATNTEHSFFYTTHGGGLVPPDLNELSRETR
jgi:hypothetical protein